MEQVNVPAVPVDRPEVVFEEAGRVVLALERREALPVLPVARLHARGRFVAAEELVVGGG